MTTDDLQAIRDSLAATTPGEWYRVPGANGYVFRSREPHNANGFRVDDCRGPGHDAAFIVAAHNQHVPKLLDEVERLTRLLLEFGGHQSWRCEHPDIYGTPCGCGWDELESELTKGGA